MNSGCPLRKAFSRASEYDGPNSSAPTVIGKHTANARESAEVIERILFYLPSLFRCLFSKSALTLVEALVLPLVLPDPPVGYGW